MSKEKRRVPKLRFPGFTEDWEQRKFGELFILKSGVAFKLSEYTKTGIPIINGESIKAGKISLEKINYLPNEYQYKYQECLLFPGDIVLGLNRPIIDGTLKISRIPADIKKSLLYQRAGKIIFKVNMDENFTYQLLSKEVLTFTKKEAVGSDQPFITTTKLNKWDLYFPVKDKERRNIGSLFNNIDNIITLHQRKLNNLKLKKKALLQKLFPKNGERYPELRFPGFTDAWEQRKLNDFVTIRRGLTYKPSDIAENGIRVLRSSNIDEDQFIKSNDDVFVNLAAVNIPFAKNGDILITSANGSNRLVGKHTIINDVAENSAVPGGFMLLAESNNPLFTDALLSSNWYKRFINTYVAGGNGAIGNLNKSDLESQSVMVPSEHEQTKIGQWYDNINQLITLHQRKLDHLQLQKKALLQQMFV